MKLLNQSFNLTHRALTMSSGPYVKEEDRALRIEEVELLGVPEQMIPLPIDACHLKVRVKHEGPWLQYVTYPPQGIQHVFFYQMNMDKEQDPPEKEGYKCEFVDSFTYNEKYFHLFLYRRNG